ncbi:sirohydrochlorin chelatase [Nitrosopumilus sp.]|uniref:sirohydrochlorin chelatase n=1 Tax=Nitrosopumilus sp. TaxID=2024843 RepID=UPI002606931E|nr:CbiX/SirB N-terminal domain-containing protein [Nitrosopumilus sp.]
MKHGILIIDRGSREQDVRDELSDICSELKKSGTYQYTGFCFLEVVSPYIKDGISDALKHNLDRLTIVPYFLYPGRKWKLAVKTAMEFQKNTATEIVITKPLNSHPAMAELVNQRIVEAIDLHAVATPKDKIDVLIIGHGSMDPDAKTALQYVRDKLQRTYKTVQHCFLEIEQPNIKQGIEICQKNNSQTLVVMLYFLHRGAHVKYDINHDLDPVMKSSTIKQIITTKHLGADPKIIDLVDERICQANSI